MITSKKITGGIIGVIFALVIMAGAVQAATVTVSCSPANAPANPILNNGGANLAAGAYVQVIDSTDSAASAPNAIDGRPTSVTDNIVSTGTLSAAGTFSKGGNSIPTGHYCYIVAWETWTGVGAPSGRYGISAVSPAMAGLSYIFRPVSFRTNQAFAPTITILDSPINVTITQGENAAARTFRVGNSGSARLDYTVTEASAWISSISPASGGIDAGGANVTHTVNFSTSTLAAGSYTADITVADPDATNNPRTVTVNLTVNAVPVTLSSIAVTPVNPSIAVGDNQQFTATGTYSDGHTADITGSVTWTSGTVAVATINAAGLATGVSRGSSTIRAASGAVSNTTNLTVSDAPDVTRPTITAFSPANGETGVPLAQNVIITFSERVNKASLVYTLRNAAGTDVAGLSVAWSDGDTRAIISHAAFANGTAYTINVADVADMAGNHLAAASSATFTSVNIVVVPPSITHFERTSDHSRITSAEVLTGITIRGSGFGAAQGTSTITFNGAAASTFYFWAEDHIDLQIPATATTGNVIVTVGGVASAGTAFTINTTPTSEPTSEAAPTISGIAPSSAYVGQTIVISGSRFGTVEGTSTITIGGVRVRPAIWSNTSITAVVPRGVSNGANEVAITTAGGTGRGTITIVGAGTGLIIDDFEGGCVGNWTAPAVHSGYYAYGTGITPTNSNITSEGPQLAAARHGARGMRVAYSYTSDWGGGWGARVVDNKDLTPYNTVTFYMRWDGSANGLNLGLKDADGNAVTAAVANARLTALAGNYASVTVNRSDFAADAAGSDAGSDGSFDWTRVANYSFTYTTHNTSAAPQYIDSIYAGEVDFGDIIIPPVTGEVVISSVNPPAAPAGTRITITGTGFGDTQGQGIVAFESIDTHITYPTDVISWTGTVIEANVPRTALTGAYILRVIRVETTAGSLRVFTSNPANFSVTANMSAAGIATIYPNPFNPSSTLTTANQTTIAWNAGGATSIKLSIFDSTARLVYSQVLSGSQTTWNGRDTQGNVVADGVYMVRITNEESKSLIAKGRVLVVKR